MRAQSGNREGLPIGWKGRLGLCACALLVALILGFAISLVLYQTNRGFFQSSVVGRVVCGAGQRIDDVTSPPKNSRRMICRDEAGVEVSARNNLIAVKLALPFFVLIAIPGLWFALTADLRTVARRRR